MNFLKVEITFKWLNEFYEFYRVLGQFQTLKVIRYELTGEEFLGNKLTKKFGSSI
ncbi:MAG: hypothetical protein BalsKO_24680 [Balneolaceae bacterium]